MEAANATAIEMARGRVWLCGFMWTRRVASYGNAL